ncbi:hypothetical protein KI387_012615, partial [Taxus chinensis]
MSMPADPSRKVFSWPNQDIKLEVSHSAEALEMIKEHLSLVLGNRNALLDSPTVAQNNKLWVGQVYAASVLYEYFLRRADQHFQLEKRMKMLPFGLNQDIDAKKLTSTHLELEDGSYKDKSDLQGSAMTDATTAPAGLDFNPTIF